MARPYRIEIFGEAMSCYCGWPRFTRTHETVEDARAEAERLVRLMRERDIPVAAHPVMVTGPGHEETIAAS